MSILLTEEETGKELGFNSGWPVRRMRIQEGLPHIRIGARIFYKMESVEQWLASREITSDLVNETDTVGVIRVIRP